MSGDGDVTVSLTVMPHMVFIVPGMVKSAVTVVVVPHAIIGKRLLDHLHKRSATSKMWIKRKGETERKFLVADLLDQMPSTRFVIITPDQAISPDFV